MLLVLVMGTTWLGASNAVREIVKELPIYRRERAVGLSIPAYVASKALVLGVLTVAQAFVLVSIATARQGGPRDAVLLGWPIGGAGVVAARSTGLAAMALGLLVSAASRGVDRAMAILPVVLIVELLLAMGGDLPGPIDGEAGAEAGRVRRRARSGASRRLASTADLEPSPGR